MPPQQQRVTTHAPAAVAWVLLGSHLKGKTSHLDQVEVMGDCDKDVENFQGSILSLSVEP